MKHFIVMMLIAALSVANVMAQKQQKEIHIVDGVLVKDFDGTQLVGKTIRSYTVDKESNIHIIFTSDYIKINEAEVDVKKILSDKTIKVESFEGDPKVTVLMNDGEGANSYEKTVFVLDGKEVSMTAFKEVDVNSMSSIDVVKNKDDKRFKKFAKEDTEVLMLITTKK